LRGELSARGVRPPPRGVNFLLGGSDPPPSIANVLRLAPPPGSKGLIALGFTAALQGCCPALSPLNESKMISRGDVSSYWSRVARHKIYVNRCRWGEPPYCAWSRCSSMVPASTTRRVLCSSLAASIGRDTACNARQSRTVGCCMWSRRQLAVWWPKKAEDAVVAHCIVWECNQ
jgi:hypothetical protein